MPFYQYECKNCGQRFEKMQSITSDPLEICELCGSGPIRRVLHPVGIIFKGSGWYATDSRKARSSGESGEGGSTGSETPGKNSSKDAAPE